MPKKEEASTSPPMDFIYWFGRASEGIVEPLPAQISIGGIYPLSQELTKLLRMTKQQGLLGVHVGQLRIDRGKVIVERSTARSHVGAVILRTLAPRSDSEAVGTIFKTQAAFEEYSVKGALARVNEIGYMGTLFQIGEEPFLVVKDPVSQKEKPPGFLRRAAVRGGMLLQRTFHNTKGENPADIMYDFLVGHLEASLRLHAASYGFAAYKRGRNDPPTHLRRFV